MHFQMTPEQESYLIVQCGDIWDLKHDAETWRKAYDERIEKVYRSMLPELPETAEAILDVGGGLSGIGARLYRHYSNRTFLAVLDGESNPAAVEVHREPFNNSKATHSFLELNGVHPNHKTFISHSEGVFGHYDLIISTQAWCFHLPPSAYLEGVAKALSYRGTLIVDVRKNKPEWKVELEKYFHTPRILMEAEKWQRIAYWKIHE